MLPPITYTDNTQPIFDGLMIHPTAYVTGYGSAAGSLRNIIRQHHASIDHALAFIDQHERARTCWWHDESHPETVIRDNAASHRARFKQASQIIRDGWKDGAARIAGLAEILKPALPEARKVYRRNFREGGAYPAIPRFLAGDPRCMVDASRAKGGSKVITLLVDCNAGSASGAAALEGRAAAAFAVADILERAGWQLEIIAFEMSNAGAGPAGKTDAVEIAVSAKRAGDPIDPLRLAFTLGHTEFLRGFLFSLDGCGTNQRDLFKRGQTDIGYVATLPAALPKGMVAENTFYVRNTTNYQLDAGPDSFTNPHATSALAMARAIIADLKAQGCPGLAED